MLGSIREEGVERTDSDDAGAIIGGDIEQLLEVGKVADPPVVFRAQGIELDRWTP